MDLIKFDKVPMRIIETSDGSHSIFSEQYQESYHSRYGAMSESLHVFIQKGLAEIQTSPIHIFEVGFGSGLNAWLSWIYAEENNCNIHYSGIELFPLAASIASELNLGELIPQHIKKFQALHLSEWDKEYDLFTNFHFQKKQADLLDLVAQELPFADNSFDIIYYDAFSPDVQPDLWSVLIFKYLFKILKPGGLLVTYCSKSVVRKTMQDAGFMVEKLHGPPHKREMLRAVKK